MGAHDELSTANRTLRCLRALAGLEHQKNPVKALFTERGYIQALPETSLQKAVIDAPETTDRSIRAEKRAAQDEPEKNQPLKKNKVTPTAAGEDEMRATSVTNALDEDFDKVLAMGKDCMKKAREMVAAQSSLAEKKALDEATSQNKVSALEKDNEQLRKCVQEQKERVEALEREGTEYERQSTAFEETIKDLKDQLDQTVKWIHKSENDIGKERARNEDLKAEVDRLEQMKKFFENGAKMFGEGT